MTDLIHKEFIVPKECHNQRIDVVLAQLWPQYSRSQITNWIKKNSILHNKHSCKPKDKVFAEDTITATINIHVFDDNFSTSVAEDIPLHILFEDDDLLIINKHAGLVVHPGAGNYDGTLINAILHHLPESTSLPRAGIIHRLDKDTTGLLIVAKNLAAQTALVRQMQERSIQRHYLTLVQGHLVSGGTIDTEFGRHPRNRLKMSVLNSGRQAITHYTINKQYHDYTLLNVKLMTGRTHQIRVHLEHIKHSVVGDMLYGKKVMCPSNASDCLRDCIKNFKRQALHAYKLTLIHPKTLDEMTFTAPLPQDFQSLLDLLDNHYAYNQG